MPLVFLVTHTSCWLNNIYIAVTNRVLDVRASLTVAELGRHNFALDPQMLGHGIR